MAAAALDQSRLTTFQHHIEDMRNLVVCKICLKPFYEPFILACGHTYCYGCLRSWFNGLDTRHKKKNCPDCRAEVRTQPAPNYLLRDLVHMFISRAELLPEDETVEEHVTGKAEEAKQLATDRKDKGLFQGIFERGGHGFASGFPPWIARSPLRDEEDDVDRCPVCMWELEEGACGHCGFGYSDEEPDMSDLEDDDSIAGSIGDFHNNGIESGFPQAHTRNVDLSDDDEAGTTGDDYPLYGEPEFSEDEHEMDDFIDDEADEDEVDEIDDDGMGIRSVRPAYQERPRRIYRIPDEDESEEDDPRRPAGRPSWMEPLERPLGTAPEDEDSSEDDERTIYDESDDDEAEDAVRTFSRRPGPRRHVVIDDEDDNEEEDEEQPHEAEGTGGSEENGDEDESEDENSNIVQDTDVEEEDDDDGQEFHDAHSETDENTTTHTNNITESEEDQDRNEDEDEDEDQEHSDADESIQLTSPPQPSARRTARLDLHRSRRQPPRPIFGYSVGPNPPRSRTTGRSYRGSTTVY